jgi:hypothetical protein
MRAARLNKMMEVVGLRLRCREGRRWRWWRRALHLCLKDKSRLSMINNRNTFSALYSMRYMRRSSSPPPPATVCLSQLKGFQNFEK